MARLENAILGNTGYGQYAEAPMVNLVNGGQNGPMPDIGQYVSSSSYVRRSLIAILIEAPRGFQDLENPEAYVEALKALVELHPKSIEGLNATLTVEFRKPLWAALVKCSRTSRTSLVRVRTRPSSGPRSTASRSRTCSVIGSPV